MPIDQFVNEETLAAVAAKVTASVGAQSLVGVSRTVFVRLVDGDEPLLEIAIEIDPSGGLVLNADGRPNTEHLLADIDSDAARSVAVGDDLLEEVFASGGVRLVDATPEDYRLAPALEALLEALHGCGVID